MLVAQNYQKFTALRRAFVQRHDRAAASN